MPSLDVFIESLIQEQDKLIQMGALKSSINHDILDRESNNTSSKGKKNGKDKKNTKSKPKENLNPSDEASCSKKDKQRKV